MTKPVELVFHDAAEGRLLLPRACSLSVSRYEAQEVREAVAVVMEEVLYALALNGMDLRALDGITFSQDCRAEAMALQGMPVGKNPLELGHQPDTMEMARTVAVGRGKELRFHIVFRAGVGLIRWLKRQNFRLRPKPLLLMKPRASNTKAIFAGHSPACTAVLGSAAIALDAFF